MTCNRLLKDSRHWDKSNLGNIEIDLANCVFDNNYIIIEPLEATNLYKCIKKSTFEPFICKVSLILNVCFLTLLEHFLKNSFLPTL